jgi:GntR family transcriptional regulator, transcriptional repressor for pyruvate dehydrogenase complex
MTGGAAERRSVSEEVAARIRAFIRAEGLEPGDRLGRQEDLARRFGVSRPTLREALGLLAGEHLIRTAKGPGGGIFVAATPEQGIGLSVSAAVASMLNADSIELDELMETRILLEAPLAGLAARRATPADIAELEALLSEMDGDPARIAALDARLDRLVADLAGNRLAAAFAQWIVDVLRPRVTEVIAPAVVEAVFAEQHRRLVEAIARSDPAGAETAMREHLVYVRDLLSAVSP